MAKYQTSSRIVIAFTVGMLGLSAGCNQQSKSLGRTTDSLDQRSKDALAVAKDTRELALSTGDVASIIDRAATLGTPGLDGNLNANGCSLGYAIGQGSVSLQGDCSLPDGRKVSGNVSLGAASCGGAGLHAELDVTISSGAGSEHLVGSVDLSSDAAGLAVLANIKKTVQAGGHSVDKDVAACVIVDGGRLGVQGTVRKAIDGVTTRAVALDHLEIAACSELPVSGSVDVQREGYAAHVAFDAQHVEIDHDGQHVSADLDDRSSCDPQMGAIDFGRCGGCGAPAALPSGDVMNADAPADPIEVL